MGGMGLHNSGVSDFFISSQVVDVRSSLIEYAVTTSMVMEKMIPTQPIATWTVLNHSSSCLRIIGIPSILSENLVGSVIPFEGSI